MKCQIKWIDETGQTTEDQNDAIGVARVESLHDNPVRTFPICEKHARRLIAHCMTYDPGWQAWSIHELPTCEDHTELASLLNEAHETLKQFGSVFMRNTEFQKSERSK